MYPVLMPLTSQSERKFGSTGLVRAAPGRASRRSVSRGATGRCLELVFGQLAYGNVCGDVDYTVVCHGSLLRAVGGSKMSDAATVSEIICTDAKSAELSLSA